LLASAWVTFDGGLPGRIAVSDDTTTKQHPDPAR
jgi:hypothetical protein